MAANSTTITANGTISPKVFWPVVVGLALTFLGTFLAAVTPDMLNGLGVYAVPMSMALTAVAQGITAYLKKDQLREIGVEATAAVLPAAPTVLPPAPVETDTDATVADPPDTGGDLQTELDALHRGTQPGPHTAKRPRTSTVRGRFCHARYQAVSSACRFRSRPRFITNVRAFATPRPESLIRPSPSGVVTTSHPFSLDFFARPPTTAPTGPAMSAPAATRVAVMRLPSLPSSISSASHSVAGHRLKPLTTFPPASAYCPQVQL